MGWSCRREAGETLDRITETCIEQTGSQNVWIKDGRKFMFETSRKEHDDGSITGMIWEFYPEGHIWAGRVKKSGSFRIEGNGKIKRFPHNPSWK